MACEPPSPSSSTRSISGRLDDEASPSGQRLASARTAAAAAPDPAHAGAATKAPGDGEGAKTQGETGEAKKKAEADARARERLAKLAKQIEAEKARWTDALRAQTRDLAGPHSDLSSALDAILAGAHRMPGNAARDKYRHPKQTLAFFGVTPTSKVLEIGPGAGWYTEILAPLLAARGALTVTDYDANGPELAYSTYNARRLQAFLARSPELFGKVRRVVSSDPKHLELGPPGSVDVVLLIRGMHGWQNAGTLATNLKKVHAVLVPGGTLGIVQHRAKPGADPSVSAKQGYLPQAYVIEQAQAAGFELVAASELNANPKDTTDHPDGVWSLPPTLAGGDKDRDKFLAIGESDRMTLKFRRK